MKTVLKYNLSNVILLIFFMVLFCVDLGKGDIVSAIGNGFVAIFNMFLILVVNQSKILSKLEDNKEK